MFQNPELDLSGKSVLITGGTGSFGREFVRSALGANPPDRLIIFSRDEQKQYEMSRELAGNFPEHHSRLRFFIGDVRDASRLEIAMRDVDIVVHTAALKLVPTAEFHPFECVLTNVHGAENVVQSALRAGVERVIALSTDKAANPVNLYGATKLAADKIIVAANNLSTRRRIRFSVVRYGNVLGSRGSVVPLFDDLVRSRAKSLPITDPRMTRFWITLRQGVCFVLSSLAIMEGGEIFVPKIPSMRTVDIAKAIAPGLAHEIVGIRPGEKLHEIMISEDDARMTYELSDRYVICPPSASWLSEWIRSTGATKVAEGFRYSSDLNPEMLDEAGLLRLLGRDRR